MKAKICTKIFYKTWIQIFSNDNRCSFCTENFVILRIKIEADIFICPTVCFLPSSLATQFPLG